MKEVNKYKLICVVLAIALLASMTRLIVLINNTSATPHLSNADVVMSNILQRKSVRSFTNQPIEKSKLDTLVRAAMAAPTGKDMRPWKFVVVNDKQAMKSLAAQLPYAKMLAEAQAAIVVCGDMSVVDKDGKPSINWTFDCSAATENLLLQAEVMGLGAVWTGAYPYDERVAAVKVALKLPDNIIPLNVIPIGYPKGNPQPKDKYNADNIHYNLW